VKESDHIHITVAGKCQRELRLFLCLQVTFKIVTNTCLSSNVHILTFHDYE